MLENMMPTSGTMTTSLNWIRWMNQTKTHVPRTAQTKEKAARPHRVEPVQTTKPTECQTAQKRIVAPVVGETNLFMQSCCMISPATPHADACAEDGKQTRQAGDQKDLHVSTLPVKPGQKAGMPAPRQTKNKTSKEASRREPPEEKNSGTMNYE